MRDGKIWESFSEAVSDIPDGATLMMVHFAGPGGLCQNLILALRDHGAKNLTVISCANFGFGGGTRIKPDFKEYIDPHILVENGQVKKGICTWQKGDGIGRNAFETATISGKVEAEIVPLGVLSHRIRAGGTGVPAFYSPVGVGTLYARNKETRVFNGREYILEYPLRADFGFVRAYKADKMGNLVYKGTGKTVNPLIAKACDKVLVEVDEIVEIGELGPEEIVTPGIYVDRIIQVPQKG
ncbi:MAG: 3-oxoacid CoA-transferase subunit A [Pseudomonadota bacterium]